MSPNKSRRIRTVQHGDQSFTPTELDLLHTPALQRLYDLHQLGLADRIFIDASHARLHHVVGVVEQADNIMQAIMENLRKSPLDKLQYGTSGEITKGNLADFAQEKLPAVRLMALLHDLTHAPYGHTLEDEIELVGEKHDEPGRQADAFFRLILQYFGWIERNFDLKAWGVDSRTKPAEGDHAAQLAWFLDSPDLNAPPASSEFISYLVARWTGYLSNSQARGRSMRKIKPSTLRVFVRDLVYAMRALSYLDIAHKGVEQVKAKHLPLREYPFEKLLHGMLAASGESSTTEDKFEPQRDVFLLDVIGNTICADLLDYARRDAVAAGLKLDYDPQRIVDQMTVVTSGMIPPTMLQDSEGTQVAFPFAGSCLRTCISLFSHKLRTDVPGELLNLLQVRYFVYERMLFHPTKCIAGAVLGAGLQFIGWKSLPVHWRFVGDQVFLHQATEAARLVRDLLAAEDKDALYDRELVDRLISKLDGLPVTGTSAAARQLLEDRLLLRDTLLEHLQIANLLNGQRHFCESLDTLVKGCAPGIFDSTTAEAVITEMETNLGKTIPTGQAADWLRSQVSSVVAVREEIKAGIRLLDRLGARRYLKIVFRLLPNADLGAGGTASHVADMFKKPLVRKIAEREIERRAELPAGSLVIHCPPVKGPAKIARILITNTDKSGSSEKPKVAMLNEIGKIDSAVFQKHQDAIAALEAM